MAKEIREEKARQGRWGYPVLIVLVCGLLLAAIAWWGAEIYGENIDTGPTISPSTVQENRTPPGPTQQ